MVPLAAVLSPNMAVQVVADARNPENVVFSPLNGGMTFSQRFGLCGRQVLSHLRWINGNFAATLEIVADQEIPLIDIADAAPIADSALENTQENARLHGCLGELAEREQTALRAAYFDGNTYEELAARMSVPLGTMKSWIRRGLLKLRTCLER